MAGSSSRSSTDFPMSRVSHQWTINKFSTLFQARRKVKSTPFTGPGSVEWHLELDPSHSDHRDRPGRFCTQVKLYLDKKADSYMTVDWQLSINHFYDTMQTKFLCNVGCLFERPECYEMVLIDQDKLDERASILLPRDTLNLFCELNVSFLSALRTTGPAMVSTVVPAPCSTQAVHKITVEDSLSSDLEALLQDGQLSDFMLIAEAGKEFPAHRAILSARSPVFKAMFQHDMREKAESQLIISDLSADTVQGMLQWIYTGRLPSTEQESKNLLCAADKYNLMPLKNACERSLCQSIKVNNVMDLFELADLYRASYVKNACVQVIVANSKQVKATEGWQRLEKERIDLLAELVKILMDLPLTIATRQT